MTLQVFGGGVSQAAVDAAVAAKKTLTDYANVVVVDAGGNGDYTSLATALAAITDSSATNRYAIMLFGRHVITNLAWSQSYIDVFGFGAIVGAATAQTITFTNTGLVTLNNIIFEANAALTFSTGALVTIHGCSCAGNITVSGSGAIVSINDSTTGRIVSVGAGALLEANGVKPTASSLLTVTGIARFFNCQFTFSGANGRISIATGGRLELYSSTVVTTNGTGALIVMASASSFICYNSKVDHTVARTNSYEIGALSITMTPTLVDCVGSMFIGDVNHAVDADSAFNNARFFHCVFDGGTTNITCLAGTGNGSSISF